MEHLTPSPRALWTRLLQDERGSSHLEYALIAVFAGTLLVGSLLILTGGLNTFYQATANTLANLL